MNDLTTLQNNGIAELAHTVEAAEAELLKYEQTACPVRHIYGPGIYIREVTLPAGSWCIGHHQNFEHMNVMISGKVKMYHPDGTTSILTAPCTFIGQPGRKAGYVIEETVWQNVYAETEQDVEKLEAKYLTKSAVSLEYNSPQLLLENSREADRADYQLLLQELGMTEEQVQEQVLNTEDQTDLPAGSYKFEVAPSSIHGQGVFATADLVLDEMIGPARIGDKRTVLGRMVNHSRAPNAIMVPKGNNVYLFSMGNIHGKHGGQLGEEITIDYRFTIAKQREREVICQQ